MPSTYRPDSPERKYTLDRSPAMGVDIQPTSTQGPTTQRRDQILHAPTKSKAAEVPILMFLSFSEESFCHNVLSCSSKAASSGPNDLICEHNHFVSAWLSVVPLQSCI